MTVSAAGAEKVREAATAATGNSFLNRDVIFMRDAIRFLSVVRLSDGFLVWPEVVSTILFWAGCIPVKSDLALYMPPPLILLKWWIMHEIHHVAPVADE